MRKLIFILIIITILACAEGNDAVYLNDGTELIAPDTPATPINVVK